MKEDNNGKKRRRRRSLGRHFVIWGALGLIALTVWEGWIRWEDCHAWWTYVKTLCDKYSIKLLDALKLMKDVPEMVALGYKLLFLPLCAVFALYALTVRNRPIGSLTLLPLGGGVLWYGQKLGILSLDWYNYASLIKLIPFALVLVGVVVTEIQCILRRAIHPKRREDDAPPPPRHKKEPDID